MQRTAFCSYKNAFRIRTLRSTLYQMSLVFFAMSGERSSAEPLRGGADKVDTYKTAPVERGSKDFGESWRCAPGMAPSRDLISRGADSSCHGHFYHPCNILTTDAKNSDAWVDPISGVDEQATVEHRGAGAWRCCWWGEHHRLQRFPWQGKMLSRTEWAWICQPRYLIMTVPHHSSKMSPSLILKGHFKYAVNKLKSKDLGKAIL